MQFLTELIFRRLIRRGCLNIIQPSGKTVTFGDPAAKPNVTVQFTDYFLPLKLMANVHLALGEGYMDGRLKIINGTLYQFLELLAMNYGKTPPALPERFTRNFAPLLQRIEQYNSRRRARKNVSHHYDLSNDFYRLFLDHDMQYSCAYFEHPHMDLETAQFKKKEHIAQKLLLRPGMRVLDIGCG